MIILYNSAGYVNLSTDPAAKDSEIFKQNLQFTNDHFPISYREHIVKICI